MNDSGQAITLTFYCLILIINLILVFVKDRGERGEREGRERGERGEREGRERGERGGEGLANHVKP